MSTRGQRVTIMDVADRAGVSRTTVSNAMNGKGHLSAGTVARVRQVAEELGYEPNAVARGLRQSRLGVISLIIRPLDTLDTANPEGVDYFLRFAGSAALSAVDRGYGLLLSSDPTLGQAPPSALAADGFIVDSPIEGDPLIELLTRRGTPFVTVGTTPDSSAALPAVTHDAMGDTITVLDHLSDRGARRIALLTGTDRNDWNRVVAAAYTDWMEAGSRRPEILSLDEARGVEGGRDLGRRILSRADRPDAVFCLTGRHAAGVAHAAVDLGLRIPEDVQVVAGSDAVVCRTFDPPITAVDLQPEKNARTAVNALVGILAGEEQDWPLTGATNQLVVRGSTRPA